MALQKGQLPCGKCGGSVDVELQATPSIVNRECVSLVIVDHSGCVTCPHCLTQQQVIVQGVAGMAIRLTGKVQEGLILQ